MGDWVKLSGGEVVEAGQRLLAVADALDAASPEAAAGELGWAVISSRSWGATVDLTMPTDRGRGFIAAGHGSGVDSITVAVTDRVKGSEGPAFLRDAFAEAAGALAGAFGDPTARTAGDRPALRWRRGDTTLLLKGLADIVELSVRRTAVDDRIREADAEMGLA